MKKLFFVLIILLYITGIQAYCQNDDFEGGFIFPSFQKFRNEYPADWGKNHSFLYQVEVSPGGKTADQSVLLNPNLGVAYALILIEHPAKLIKDGFNLIHTTKGSIIIFLGTKNQYKGKWCLTYTPKIITKSKLKKVKIFYAKNKEPVSL